MSNLVIAVKEGNIEKVANLLKYDNVTVSDRNAALALALVLNKFEIYKLLYKPDDNFDIIESWYKTCQ